MAELTDWRFPKAGKTKFNIDFNYLFYKPEHNLTVIKIEHYWDYSGTFKEFTKWGWSSVGGIIVTRHIVDLINYLIDQITLNYKDQPGKQLPYRDFPYIRHIGFRDLNFYDIHAGEKHCNFFSSGMMNDAVSLSHTEGMTTVIDYPLDTKLPFEKLRLFRAIELLDSGYVTEAILVVYALLDSYVQNELIILLNHKNIEEPEEFLRKIQTRRLETYLHEILKVLSGHSLKEEQKDLWKQLKKVNIIRNKAIHEATDPKYDDVKDAIILVRDIILYLKKIEFNHTDAAESEDVILKKLDIEFLPFLFRNKRKT